MLNSLDLASDLQVILSNTLNQSVNVTKRDEFYILLFYLLGNLILDDCSCLSTIIDK